MIFGGFSNFRLLKNNSIQFNILQCVASRYPPWNQHSTWKWMVGMLFSFWEWPIFRDYVSFREGSGSYNTYWWWQAEWKHPSTAKRHQQAELSDATVPQRPRKKPVGLYNIECMDTVYAAYFFPSKMVAKKTMSLICCEHWPLPADGWYGNDWKAM